MTPEGPAATPLGAGITPGIDDLDLVLMAAALCGARHIAFMATSPILTKKVMPRLVRLALAASLSFISAPASYEALQADPTLSAQFLPLLIKELALGFLLGVLVWLPIRGLEFAAVVLDTQRGNSNGGDQDPLFGATTTPTGILLQQIFSGYFFASGAFLVMLGMLIQSTVIWPPTASVPWPSDAAREAFITMSGQLFFVGMVFALPIAGFMLLADIVIAFVARSAPTLNALVFGMPVKSAVLLVMLIFYVDQAFPALVAHFNVSLENLERVFRHE